MKKVLLNVSRQAREMKIKLLANIDLDLYSINARKISLLI